VLNPKLMLDVHCLLVLQKILCFELGSVIRSDDQLGWGYFSERNRSVKGLSNVMVLTTLTDIHATDAFRRSIVLQAKLFRSCFQNSTRL